MALSIQDWKKRPEDPRALTSGVMLIAARGSVATTDASILGRAHRNGGVREKPTSLDKVALAYFRAEDVRHNVSANSFHGSPLWARTWDADTCAVSSSASRKLHTTSTRATLVLGEARATAISSAYVASHPSKPAKAKEPSEYTW